MAALRFVTAGAFASQEEAGAEALVTDAEGGAVIPAGGFVLVYGGGGAGKTTLVLDLLVHLASATLWLGLLTPARALRVAVIENEGPRAEFRHKLGRKLDAWPGASERIIVLEEPWQAVTFRDPAHREQLAEALTEHEIDLLVAAPLSRLGMQGGGTLDDIGDFVGFVSDVQARCERPPTVLLVHHENRAGQVSGAWDAAPDTLLHVKGQGHGRTFLDWQKLRWSGLHGTTTQLVWAEHESFTVADREEVTEEAVAEQIIAAARQYPHESWTKLRSLNDDSGHKRIRGNDGMKGRLRDQLIQAGVLVNTAPREGQFRLHLADDPDEGRANLSTALARPGDASPDGGPASSRAAVPYVSRHGTQHGTAVPGPTGAAGESEQPTAAAGVEAQT